MRLNALWWWIDRWRKSTAYTDMTLEEQGAYRNLLDEANLRGGAIPNNERILAKACGDALAWPRVRDNVLYHFELQADGWHNTTLDRVIAEATRRAEKQARYRQTVGNAIGNVHGNKAGNAEGSPISDLRSPISDHKDQEQERASRVLRDETNIPNPNPKPLTTLEEKVIIDRMCARGAIRSRTPHASFESIGVVAAKAVK